MTKLVASQLVPVISRGARIVRDVMREVIQDQLEPSEPFQPPASPSGRYERSWRAGRAIVFDDAVVASAFTEARAANGENLGDMLEHGTEKMAPRPHRDQAIERARPAIESLVRESEQQLGE